MAQMWGREVIGAAAYAGRDPGFCRWGEGGVNGPCIAPEVLSE